ncbi:MAG: ABC transporter permease [Dehalococcoidia bacterium]
MSERAPVAARPAGNGRIVDRGYQHYDGPRHGPAVSVQAIALGTMRRGLGFKRPGSAKILPFLLIIAAIVPGVVAVGIRMLFPDRVLRRLSSPDQLLKYPAYFALLSVLILVLAALTAPEALCPDRRQRVLSLYYASPIRPALYLLGQVLAIVAVLLLITLIPPLLLWVANVGLDNDSLGYAKDHVDQLLRIIASGVVLAVFNAALGLAVASATDRKAYAAGTLLGGTLLLSSIARIVRGAVHAEWANYTPLLDPVALPIRVMRWIFGLTSEPNLSGWLSLAAVAVIVGICMAAVLRVYRRVSF